MSRTALSLLATLCLTAFVIIGSLPASAEVRFGKNVRIGGHDVSNQTFNKKKRGEYHVYEGKPAKQGCSWRKNADGSKTKVCHLQRKQ